LTARRLDGKTAIVTGATLGIGHSIARRLVDEGASVVLVARDRARGEVVASELGAAASFVAADVTRPDAAEAVADAALADGAIDILVNNAGIDHTGDLLATDEEDVRRVMETNFFGALWMLQRVGRDMKARSGGSIINITSRLASIGVPTMAIYAASKGALLALTRSAAVELAPHGVRVNAVAPGLTQTPLLDDWIAGQPDPETHRRSVLATIPQGRFAAPDDVAAAVAYLAADESSHVTGASIPVDGGYTAA
jgi:NAD(P)-dependent dehydrogenase (short-subunit alcohol dehydrogenase family)